MRSIEKNILNGKNAQGLATDHMQLPNIISEYGKSPDP